MKLVPASVTGTLDPCVPLLGATDVSVTVCARRTLPLRKKNPAKLAGLFDIWALSHKIEMLFIFLFPFRVTLAA
jgi:hypothetical protein